MTEAADLFSRLGFDKRAPQPVRAAMPNPHTIGHGNGHFLADLAMGVSDDQMRQNFKAGRYADLHLPSVPHWRRLAGRAAA